MNALTILASILSMTNPHATTCATINNTTNETTWRYASGRTVTASYRDYDGLVYDRPVPRIARMAEEALQYGEPGPKTITVCQ